MNRNYDDPQYKEWRKKVAARDNYCCQWPNCGSKKRLRFHHIRTWAKYPLLRFEVDNGVTLCDEHHKVTIGNEEDFERMFFELVKRIKEKGPQRITKKQNNRRVNLQQQIRAELRKNKDG